VIIVTLKAGFKTDIMLSLKLSYLFYTTSCNYTERLLTAHRIWVLHKKQVVMWVMPQDVLTGKM